MAKMIKTKINGKWDIVLPEHRANRPEYHKPPYWEAKRLCSMQYHINDGDVMIYVGAEEGEMAALCQMWGAKVVLVEPNPKVWPNIKAIWEANKLEMPLECYEGFASDEDSEDYVKGRYGNGVWPEHANEQVIGNHGFKELYLERNNYPNIKIDTIPVIPNVLSIDVEGSEWRVLEGAAETLKRHKPKIWLSIHPEYLFHQWGEYQYDLRNWIKDFGYKETILDYQHELHVYYEPI